MRCQYTTFDKLGAGAMQGYIGTGNRSGAGASIRLDDITVERDGTRPQRLSVYHCPQRTSDEPLDLLRAPAYAPFSLARTAGMSSARQHAIFRRDPTQALAF